MTAGEFRFAFYPEDYEATVAFYRQDLQLEVLEAWDRGTHDRGTLFAAASGIIEAVQQPGEQAFARPRGALVIEVEDVDAWHALARSKGLPIEQEPTDKPWGHRDLRLIDPNGLVLVFFSSRSRSSPRSSDIPRCSTRPSV